ncbi:MAG TPA: long-chain fatty acid--CoA ligase [Candidatus Hydrogenedentes bacterium]|nr:long-chain fatty acid--CoA ligase [Candidatus Hydrogenedentota bacterium]
MLNLSILLEESARQFPDKDAIVFDQIRLTYKQVDAMANQLANGLTKAGVRRGDKVCVCCPNLPYFPIMVFGILKVGAVVVPLNPLLRRREFAYHLTDSDAVGFICFEGTEQLPVFQEAYAGWQDAKTCPHIWIIPTIPGADSPVEGVPTLMSLLHNQSPVFDAVPTRPDDTCLIIYTSGTTGRPKGAELTHSNITINSMVVRDMGRSTKDDKLLVVLPLFHSFGFTCQMMAGILTGVTLVLQPRFDAGNVLRAFQDEGITMFAGVPTMYWDLLSYPELEKFDVAKIANTLRVCNSGGAAMPVEVMKRFEEKFNVTILEGYGLSETSPVASFNQLERPRKPGSIGTPVWGVEMKIVDHDMNELPTGQPGEIVIRGHNIMKGYYKRDEANDEAFRGGWFHSGDIGYRDEDGYYFIVDRVKDMIIRGGFNVYPREVEEVLMTHPDVSLAAVIGIPHEEYGEEVCAYVIPQTGANITESELIAWAKKEMAAYKYPRHIEIVKSLPLGPTGKILKTELRKAAAEKVGAAN